MQSEQRVPAGKQVDFVAFVLPDVLQVLEMRLSSAAEFLVSLKSAQSGLIDQMSHEHLDSTMAVHKTLFAVINSHLSQLDRLHEAESEANKSRRTPERPRKKRNRFFNFRRVFRKRSDTAASAKERARSANSDFSEISENTRKNIELLIMNRDREVQSILRKLSNNDLLSLLLYSISPVDKNGILSNEILSELALPETLSYLLKRNNQLLALQQILGKLNTTAFNSLGYLLFYIHNTFGEESSEVMSTISTFLFMNGLLTVSSPSPEHIETIKHSVKIGNLFLSNAKLLWKESEVGLNWKQHSETKKLPSSKKKDENEEVSTKNDFYKSDTSFTHSSSMTTNIELQNDFVVQTEEEKKSMKRHKTELKTFYEKECETRFIPVIDDLFELFSFKTICLGLYAKYDDLPSGWINELISLSSYHLTSQERLFLEIDGVTQRPQKREFPANSDKTFRYRAKKERLISTEKDEMLENITHKDKTFENTNKLVMKIIGINERLNKLKKFYVDEQLSEIISNSKKEKARFSALELTKEEFNLLFGSEFIEVVKIIDKIAVELEVLNIVRKPVELTKNVNRLDILLDALNDENINELYNSLKKYMYKSQYRKLLIQTKTEILDKNNKSKLQQILLENSNEHSNAVLSTKEKESEKATPVVQKFDGNIRMKHKQSALDKTFDLHMNLVTTDMSNLSNSSDNLNFRSKPSKEVKPPRDRKMSASIQRTTTRQLGSAFFRKTRYPDFLTIWTEKIQTSVPVLKSLGLLSVMEEPGSFLSEVTNGLDSIAKYLDEDSTLRKRTVKAYNNISEGSRNLEKYKASQSLITKKVGNSLGILAGIVGKRSPKDANLRQSKQRGLNVLLRKE